MWSAVIHGASGIAYFQHNNDPACGNYALVECSAELRRAVAQVNGEVAALAEIINSPSYEWNFGPGLDTMLKLRGGEAFVFAMPDGATGARTLQLPPGMRGWVVESVRDGRSLAVDRAGRFSVDFAHEYEHGVYRIAPPGSTRPAPTTRSP